MELVVKKQTALYVLLIFPILKINYLLHFPLFTLIYQLILLFDLGYCVILYLKRKQTPAEFVFLFLLLEMWLYIQTYIKQGDIPEVMRVARSVICMAMIFDLFSNNIRSLIKCLYYYFFVFAVINLLLMILFPNGIYSVYSSAYSTNTTEWLFGVGNVSISWHYPAVVVAWIYSTLLGNKKYGWYMSAVALISHLIDGSATTIVGILIILIIQNISFLKKILKPKIGCILVAAAFVIVVVQQKFDFLQTFIVGFLGKDMTFTGRLMIWKNAINAILKNPISGYGVMYSKDIPSLLGIMPDVDYIWAGATHCHDNYLQILFTGGLVAGLIYFLLYRSAIKQLTQNWEHPVAKVISGCLFSFFVIQISEAFDNCIIIYLVIVLAVNSKRLIEAYQELDYKHV